MAGVDARRRAAAAYQNGVTAFGAGVAHLATAFLTHLHSDHTMGYPDLIFTPWLMGRREIRQGYAGRVVVGCDLDVF